MRSDRLLKSRGLFTIKPGLERLRKLLEAAGNPQERLRYVHIAGTNGKGSVAATLETVFRYNGYRTGFYFSPHLENVRERIQVNRDWISERDFDRYADQILQLEKKLHLELTYFEILTAIAYLYFAEQKVDIVILECGLGGRWDATNVITRSDLSIITSIDFDHMQWLGNTLSKIASEKAGIIKPGGTVITTACGAASRVIGQHAKQVGALFYQSGVHFSSKPVTQTTELSHQELLFAWADQPTKQYRIRLLGKHQIENMGAVLAACHLLQIKGWKLSRSKIRSALQEVRWPARLEYRQLNSGVHVLFDGAHNRAGVIALKNFLEHLSKLRPITILFGAYRDKEIQKMIPLLEKITERFILCDVGSRRAAKRADYQKVIQRPTFFREQPESAFKLAQVITPKGGCLVVCGSLSLVGNLRLKTDNFVQTK